MSEFDKAGQDWDRTEIDAIVADYFAMRDLSLAGKSFVKLHRYRDLSVRIGRNVKSIERKHQNISAILDELCEPWVPGLAPLRNYQQALSDGIERFLLTRDTVRASVTPDPVPGGAEGNIIFLEPPPLPSERAPIPDHVQRLVRKFDPALRDARNRALGKRGEELALRSERARLEMAERPDLARKVRWVSEEDGDGAGYDILSFDVLGSERFLEIKTTSGPARTPFYVSANEKSFAEECPDRFRLYRLYDFVKSPKAFTLQPPFEPQLHLEPANYRASL